MDRSSYAVRLAKAEERVNELVSKAKLANVESATAEQRFEDHTRRMLQTRLYGTFIGKSWGALLGDAASLRAEFDRLEQLRDEARQEADDVIDELKKAKSEEDEIRDALERSAESSVEQFEDVPRKVTAAAIDSFHGHVKIMLSMDYAEITAFPEPPFALCERTVCQQSEAGRALKACSCNIKTTFEVVPATKLKASRLQWHPDKWAKCPDAVRDDFQKKAAEVFVVVDGLYQAAGGPN